jgi:hypothetical protein
VKVDLDVALTEQAPGRAVGVVAESRGGAHGVPPFRLRLASLPVRMFPGPLFDYLFLLSRLSGVLPIIQSYSQFKIAHATSGLINFSFLMTFSIVFQ